MLTTPKPDNGLENKGFFGATGAIPAENVWAHD
jgi:hypothetical protein